MITKEELLEIGFVEIVLNIYQFGNIVYFGNKVMLVLDSKFHEIPNATTIQDIKDLIRLFNIEK